MGGWPVAAGPDREDGGGSLNHIKLLNENVSLNFLPSLITNPDPDDFNPYTELVIDSSFYDPHSFISKFSGSAKPLFLNINIQSLNSKFEKLKNFVLSLINGNVHVDIIALQETWCIKHPDLLDIPGFQPLIFRNRKRGRGGGIGYYIRNGISYSVNVDLSPFVDKIFESLSLDISYTYGDNQKQFTVSNIYRSPSPTNGLTANEQFDDFHSKFDDLLSKLSNKKVDVYVFLDSNINLFNLDVNNQATTYMANISNSGFLLTNFRATRIQNDSPSLIDHILTNCKATVMTSGTIVDDLSDHFMTFFQPNLSRLKTKPKCMKKRLYTTAKLDDFKRDLQSINWKPVTDMTDVDTCYDQFWQIYSKLHDHHFPLTTTKFNKNVHRISDFMTTGLLISRSTKLKLHKVALTDNAPFNWIQYRTYRNIFNKTVKLSKKIHYQNNIERNAKNPKKTWDILRELTTGKKAKVPIDKIKIDGKIITDPTSIAENFNNFFTRVGRDIADAVEPTSGSPTDYLTNTPPPPPPSNLNTFRNTKL